MVGVAAAEPSPCALEAGGTRTVVRVLDGETIALDDGAEVRLIGALSPRATDAAAEFAAWPLAAVAQGELERLVLGKSVELGFAGRRTDRHGRLLAHVFVIAAESRIWVQGHMLKAGLARAYSLPENTACMDEISSHEQLSRESRAGLWADAAYRIRSADDVFELLRFRSTYQIVEGRVLNVADVRGRIFLNFGADWRRDFTVSIHGPARRLTSGLGLEPKSLEGRAVRVRGWIDRRGGPFVGVHHPHQIEALEAGRAAAPAEPSLSAPRSRSRARARAASAP